MTLERLPFERTDDGVVTLWLQQPARPVVVLDSALLNAIDRALDDIGAEPAGFVLASRGRVFVAGANLAEVMDLDDDALDEYLRFGSRVYARLATLPCTTVAAINGAALGGGLEIAMHCDHLIGATPPTREDGSIKPYLVGLPEAGLSICPGWGGTCLLPARMDVARAIELTAAGRPMTVFDAAEAGLIEELVDAPRLVDRAREIARTSKGAPRREPVSIGAPALRTGAAGALDEVTPRLPDTQAARAVAECVRAGVTLGWDACLEAERKNLIRLRNTDEGREAIAAFFERSGGKS